MTTLRKALPLILALCALPGLLSAQAQNDCTAFTTTVTGNATGQTVANLSQNNPCINWRVTFSTTGTLSTSVTFQTSPDNSTWTSVPNTICSSSVQPPCILQGANPTVGTQGTIYISAYGAYVRVITTSSSGTGTGTIRVYGAKGATANAPPSSGGGSGTVTSIATTSPITGGTITGTGTIGLDTTKVAQKFFGTAAPGSVATNLPGDLFTDTTAHNEYVCNSPAGTAAPACTSVTAAGWLLVNTPGLSGLTTNTIPKAASASTLTDSVIKDDGTAVTITQNSVVPFTSVASGAVADTLRLQAGNLTIIAPVSGSVTGVIYKGAAPFIHNFVGIGGDGNNTFIGMNSGNLTMGPSGGASSLGSSNTAQGAYSLQSNTTGSYNSAQGVQSLQSNTTGSDNSAQGFYSLQSNTTGNYNSAQGFYSLQSNTTGNYNSAQGVGSLQSNTTGSYNIGLGFDVLQGNTTGNYNSAQGFYSLQANTTGSYNNAQGVGSLQSNTTGNYNSAQGFDVLQGNTTGSFNVGVGPYAGYTATPANANVSGSNNVWIGANSGPGSATQYNYQAVIGSDATSTCNNCVVLGRANGNDTVYVGDAGTSPMIVVALATTPVLTANLRTCTASTGIPWRASVSDATLPALGVALTGGGAVFANVHCSRTTGTYIVDGL